MKKNLIKSCALLIFLNSIPLKAIDNKYSFGIGCLAIGVIGGSYYLYNKKKSNPQNSLEQLGKNAQLDKKLYEEALTKIAHKEELLKKEEELQQSLSQIDTIHHEVIDYINRYTAAKNNQTDLENREQEVCRTPQSYVLEWWHNQDQSKGLIHFIKKLNQDCYECKKVQAQLEFIDVKAVHSLIQHNIDTFADNGTNHDLVKDYIANLKFGDIANVLTFNKEKDICQKDPQLVLNTITAGYKKSLTQELQTTQEKIAKLVEYENFIQKYNQANK